MAKKIDFDDMEIEELIAPEAFKKLKERGVETKKAKKKKELTSLEKSAKKVRKEQEAPTNNIVQVNIEQAPKW